ncbi:MAG: methyltransferase domain-containing protein [Gemmatimonadales bacterium]
MNWRLKALVQGAVSLLPPAVSFDLYYRLQRACGSLRHVNPIAGFEDGVRMLGAIEERGRSVEHQAVLEVGTGRRLNVPLAFWLCGAAKILTVDLHPYLKPALVREDLAFIRKNRACVEALFGDHAHQDGFQRRLDFLVRGDPSVQQLMEHAHIQYLAPLETRRLPVEDRTVDYHVSNNVLEHIPPDTLRAILVEGRRVIRDDGLLVHRIDFSDHFSEADPRISTVNFLRYSEREWRRYAGNRYGYHNRLRIDELERILQDAELAVDCEKREIDSVALRLLASGFKLDARFADKPNAVNATKNAVLVLGKSATLGRRQVN